MCSKKIFLERCIEKRTGYIREQQGELSRNGLTRKYLSWTCSMSIRGHGRTPRGVTYPGGGGGPEGVQKW